MSHETIDASASRIESTVETAAAMMPMISTTATTPGTASERNQPGKHPAVVAVAEHLRGSDVTASTPAFNVHPVTLPEKRAEDTPARRRNRTGIKDRLLAACRT